MRLSDIRPLGRPDPRPHAPAPRPLIGRAAGLGGVSAKESARDSARA
jgi:hypothetical protein